MGFNQSRIPLHTFRKCDRNGIVDALKGIAAKLSGSRGCRRVDIKAQGSQLCMVCRSSFSLDLAAGSILYCGHGGGLQSIPGNEVVAAGIAIVVIRLSTNTAPDQQLTAIGGEAGIAGNDCKGHSSAGFQRAGEAPGVEIIRFLHKDGVCTAILVHVYMLSLLGLTSPSESLKCKKTFAT